MSDTLVYIIVILIVINAFALICTLLDPNVDFSFSTFLYYKVWHIENLNITGKAQKGGS